METSFPGCPLVLTTVSDTGSIPGWGPKISNAWSATPDQNQPNKKSQFSRLVIAKGGWDGVWGWGYQMEAFVYRMDKQQDPTV